MGGNAHSRTTTGQFRLERLNRKKKRVRLLENFYTPMKLFKIKARIAIPSMVASRILYFDHSTSMVVFAMRVLYRHVLLLSLFHQSLSLSSFSPFRGNTTTASPVTRPCGLCPGWWRFFACRVTTTTRSRRSRR
jgi:hypothetical protein